MRKTKWTFGTTTVAQGRTTRSKYADHEGRLWDVTCTCGFTATLFSRTAASNTARTHARICKENHK